jgi:ribosome maturation factor RimP
LEWNEGGAYAAPFLLLMSAETTQHIYDLLVPVVADEGYELLDVQIAHGLGGKTLKLFIDKDGGVLLGDCSKVSHAVEDLIEVENAVKGKYSLEVSSPGLNRPLRTKAHFEKVIGKVVKVTAVEKLDGRLNFKGVLKEIDGEELVIHIDKQDFNVSLQMLAKACLVYEG